MIWAYAVNELNESQIQNGIRNLVHHGSEFPPSAGQFKDLCLQSFEWETRAHRMVEHTQLEDLTAKEKRVANGIEAIKKLREETGL